MRTASVGELVALAKGRKPEMIFAENGGGRQRLLQIGDLRSDNDLRFTSDNGVSVEPSDICIAWDGANAGTVGYGLRGIIGSTIARLRPDTDEVFTPYLGRYLQSQFHVLNGGSYGATIPHVSRDRLFGLRVRLPKPDEQKRIAAILDKADDIRAKRREALAQADALLRATFLDLFGNPVANPKGWNTLPIAEIIADGPQNGLYRHSSEYGSGTPILRIDSFYDGRTKDLSSLKRVRIDEETISRWALHADDIVINRVNSLDYLGKSAIVPPLREPTVFESNMMRFTVNRSIIEPGFLIDQLQTDYVRRQVRKRARPAVNQSSINQDDVKSIEVRVPPIEAQKAYVASAKRIERFGEGAGAALADANALYASLGQRAFRGEL